jgi:uncharacterized cupredoxin-like copper-binding protein
VKKLVIILLMGAAAVLAACGGTAEPAALETAELPVTATDLAFAPISLEVTAGQEVKLTLQNDGALEHDFSIMEMPHTGEVIVEDTPGDTHEHDMDNLADPPEIHVAAQPGGIGTIEFTPSTPGEYEYYCTVAGHKEAGMVGTLVVKAP